MASQNGKTKAQPRRQQARRPGLESQTRPRPRVEDPKHKGTGKLRDKVALITGGDSGIGKAVAVLFAKEGAHVAIVYLNEHSDAEETKRMVEQYGRKCLLIPGDIGYESFCRQAVERTVSELGRLDVLVNNAAAAPPGKAGRHRARAARAHLPHQRLRHVLHDQGRHEAPEKGRRHRQHDVGDGLRGQPTAHRLLVHERRDRRLHPGALSKSVAKKGIHVNGVAPGPIWTPLIPSTFPPDKVEEFGTDTPLGRVGQPDEVASCFLFLASDDSSYMTGQVLHPNGGRVVNG